MYLKLQSETPELGESTKQPIYLISQFFIHKDEERNKELQFCLLTNVFNDAVDKIYLLNERHYTNNEMGLHKDTPKIVQIVIGRRLTYADVFINVELLKLEGYVVFHNSDIFFDKTLTELPKINLHEKQSIMTQLRWEYEGPNKDIKLFGPRADSQDSWIYHTNWNHKFMKYIKAFNFEFGMPGCDNSIAYIFKIMNFGLINDPSLIHTLHYHKTEIRDYTAKDRIKMPYAMITPVGVEDNHIPDATLEQSDMLYEFIKNATEPYLIPRISGMEAICACYPSRVNPAMKNNAGVKISTPLSCRKWAKEYMKAFENCHMYGGWGKKNEDLVYRGIEPAHNEIEYLCEGKPRFWSHCLDVFDQIEKQPWTMGLENKRILIVSSFAKSMKKKVPYLDKIYGRDIFPNCKFEFIIPPQTHASNPSREWDVELDEFYERLDKITDYDVALVSAGGNGNLICNHIYETGHSAIYVGGVLQMFFGLIGGRWLDERKAIVNMYHNQYWSRPMEEEQPKDFKNIENGAYW